MADKKQQFDNDTLEYMNFFVSTMAKIGCIPWPAEYPDSHKTKAVIGIYQDTLGSYILSVLRLNQQTPLPEFILCSTEELEKTLEQISSQLKDLAIDYHILTQDESKSIIDKIPPTNRDTVAFLEEVEEDTARFYHEKKKKHVERGNAVELEDNSYLLFKPFEGIQSPPNQFSTLKQKPLRVKLHEGNSTKDDALQLIYDLINLNYKSAMVDGLPISVEYSKMIAEKMQKFGWNTIPHMVDGTYWFL